MRNFVCINLSEKWFVFFKHIFLHYFFFIFWVKKLFLIWFFKVLYDCTRYMCKYRLYVFYVGTSCDNKKLRSKIKLFEDKIFRNILLQKNTILSYFKKWVYYFSFVVYNLNLNQYFFIYFFKLIDHSILKVMETVTEN